MQGDDGAASLKSAPEAAPSAAYHFGATHRFGATRFPLWTVLWRGRFGVLGRLPTGHLPLGEWLRLN
jgi:hypothetical protein